MPSVPVTISGRTYRIACEEGEEQRLIALADEVNGKIERFRGTFDDIDDQRLMVMAAIELADDLDQTRRQLERIEAGSTVRPRNPANTDRQEGAEADLARAVVHAAQKITDLARRLNAAD